MLRNVFLVNRIKQKAKKLENWKTLSLQTAPAIADTRPAPGSKGWCRHLRPTAAPRDTCFAKLFDKKPQFFAKRFFLNFCAFLFSFCSLQICICLRHFATFKAKLYCCREVSNLGVSTLQNIGVFSKRRANLNSLEVWANRACLINASGPLDLKPSVETMQSDDDAER